MCFTGSSHQSVVINMSKTKVHKKLTSFLNKTYEIVNDSNNAATVAWTSDGMGFTINNVPDFTEHILPRYFKHSNFASFVRQLNMYDFHKSREEGCENVFRHPCFLRGRRGLLRDIHRKSTELPTESTLSKTDCQRLLAKVQELQRQHQALESTVQDLRTENRDMAQHNHALLNQLSVFKAREGKLEGLLSTFSGQLQSFNSTQDGPFRTRQDSQDVPLCLMEEDQPLEFDYTEKPQSEVRLTGEVYDSSLEYLPQSTAGPPEAADSEMDAEIELMLKPDE